MPVSLTVHESQYPEQVAEQLRQGLHQRRVPGKFLYDSPAQAQRWLAYHQAYAPSQTDPALQALYQQAFQTALQALGGAPLHYVSLGCGGGSKDVLGLAQVYPALAPVVFTPLDASVALVVETMLRVLTVLPTVLAAPLVVDFDSAPDLTSWLAQHESPVHRRLLACFGMLPNMAYGTFLPYLRRLMRPGDVLLLSANLSPGAYDDAVARIVPQYDNALARAWYDGLLDSLGLTTTQRQLRVRPERLRDDGQVWQIGVVARFQEAVRLTVAGAPLAWEAGETLEVFFSQRFTPQVLPVIVADSGLALLQQWVLTSQEEGIYLCTC